jgi:hypothetical protein
VSTNLQEQRQRRIVSRFTWVWLVGSVAASAYFAFVLFPAVYERRTSALVEVHFQTSVKTSDASIKGLVYYPNLPTFRTRHASDMTDEGFLYFDACEALPLSQRPICDSSRNWKKLDPKKVGCGSAVQCNVERYRLSEEERYILLADVKPSNGANFSIGDLQSPSLSDPGGWGTAAQLPLFFISIFLALKLGRSLGEFLFTPYEKS